VNLLNRLEIRLVFLRKISRNLPGAFKNPKIS